MSTGLIKWDESYEIGIEKIDSQHQELVRIINKFISAKLEGKETEVLKETLVNLVNYTKYHFHDEEEFMRSEHYFTLFEHMGQHKILVKQIVQILQKVKENKISINEDLFSLLRNWLLKHVMKHDAAFGEFYKRKNTKN